MPEAPNGLDDPGYAAFAWARFRNLLAWMTAFAGLCSAVSLVALAWAFGTLSWVAALATVLGVGGSVMMAAALMGLAFLSSGSGHDEDVDRFDP